MRYIKFFVDPIWGFNNMKNDLIESFNICFSPSYREYKKCRGCIPEIKQLNLYQEFLWRVLLGWSILENGIPIFLPMPEGLTLPLPVFPMMVPFAGKQMGLF